MDLHQQRQGLQALLSDDELERIATCHHEVTVAERVDEWRTSEYQRSAGWWLAHLRMLVDRHGAYAALRMVGQLEGEGKPPPGWSEWADELCGSEDGG